MHICRRVRRLGFTRGVIRPEKGARVHVYRRVADGIEPVPTYEDPTLRSVIDHVR